MNFSWAVSIWRRPFAESFIHTREAVRLANETGQFPDAGYALFNECYLGLLSGAELETVAPACDANVAYLRRVKMEGFVDGPAVIRQWALALQGRTRRRPRWTTPSSTRPRSPRRTRARACSRCSTRPQTGAAVHLRRVRRSVAVAEVAEGPIRQYTGTIWDALRVFHHSLALCAVYKGLQGAERERADAALDAHLERLARWAENAPDNFAAQHLLVAAERARAQGRAADAIERYEAAIEAGARRACPRERALASELFGRFWLGAGPGQGRRRVPRRGAVRVPQWGAAAKAAALEAAAPRTSRRVRPASRRAARRGGLRAGPGQRHEGRAGHRGRDRARGPAADAAPARAGERGG